MVCDRTVFAGRSRLTVVGRLVTLPNLQQGLNVSSFISCPCQNFKGRAGEFQISTNHCAKLSDCASNLSYIMARKVEKSFRDVLGISIFALLATL
jgi:hypothetical protein